VSFCYELLKNKNKNLLPIQNEILVFPIIFVVSKHL